MPEIYFHGDAITSEIGVSVAGTLQTLPVRKDDAVLIFGNTIALDAKAQKHPFVRIEVSAEIGDDELREMANHFVRVIDVSARNRRGIMAFREKGQEFGKDCFKLPEWSEFPT